MFSVLPSTSVRAFKKANPTMVAGQCSIARRMDAEDSAVAATILIPDGEYTEYCTINTLMEACSVSSRAIGMGREDVHIVFTGGDKAGFHAWTVVSKETTEEALLAEPKRYFSFRYNQMLSDVTRPSVLVA